MAVNNVRLVVCLTIEAGMESAEWSGIGPLEPDCASGGGAALGLAMSTVGELGTGKLIPSP